MSAPLLNDPQWATNDQVILTKQTGMVDDILDNIVVDNNPFSFQVSKISAFGAVDALFTHDIFFRDHAGSAIGFPNASATSGRPIWYYRFTKQARHSTVRFKATLNGTVTDSKWFIRIGHYDNNTVTTHITGVTDIFTDTTITVASTSVDEIYDSGTKDISGVTNGRIITVAFGVSDNTAIANGHAPNLIINHT